MGQRPIGQDRSLEMEKRYEVLDTETSDVSYYDSKRKMLLGVFYINKRLAQGVCILDRETELVAALGTYPMPNKRSDVKDKQLEYFHYRDGFRESGEKNMLGSRPC